MSLPEQKSAENLEIKESALVTAGCRPLEMNIGNTPILRV